MLYSHGNYTLAHDFTAFSVMHAVCQAKGREDKNAAFGEFLAHTVRQKRTATVTLSNGVLTASEAEHCQKARPKKVRTS